MRIKPKTVIMAALTAVLWAGALLFVSGCQSEDRVVAVETNPLCPSCYAETRTHPITGLEYTTAICLECRQVSSLDLSDDTLDAVRRYTGRGVGNTVRVCDNCQALIGECAACRQARGM